MFFRFPNPMHHAAWSNANGFPHHHTIQPNCCWAQTSGSAECATSIGKVSVWMAPPLFHSQCALNTQQGGYVRITNTIQVLLLLLLLLLLK